MANLNQLARSIFDHALAECSIERAFDRKLRVSTDACGSQLILDGREAVALDDLRRVRIVSIGKAGAAMLSSLLSRLSLPPSCDLQGVLIAPARPQDLRTSIRFFAGGHPYPSAASFAGASVTLDILHSIADSPADDALCFFLISGGASAMMELPLDPAISLADTVAFHHALIHSGASIVEINCIRKHFSAVKGGRLALAAGSARKLTLLVSDVPPDHLDALASGPTIADPTTVAECRKILARYSLLDRFPESVRRFFVSPQLPETPKPGGLASPVCKLLDSDELAEAARGHAAGLGFHTVIDNTCDDLPYNAAADYLLDRLRRLRSEHPRVCLISAGEVTVHVPASLTAGIGGRNQHFALYLATQLHPADGPLAILSAGSDGIDGNSIAAGAIVDEHTVARVNHLADAQRALKTFNSFAFLNAAGATIVTGPTGHNLRDLRILLADRQP